jgi:2,3-bisphosphoglycerate-independent phosphoglycerate mutase
MTDQEGKPVGNIQDNDSVIFFNFRDDRAKQITKAFVLPGFMKFKINLVRNLEFVTLTRYEDGLPVDVAYPPVEIGETLGKVLSRKGLLQLRISETEKFAHVTYFFNGGEEAVFLKEDRIIVPSPAIDRFDKTPQMSAKEITDKVLEALELRKYAFVLINYANADMVGHTGNEASVIKAVETIDTCLSRLIPAILLQNGCLLITSDHGNAEEEISATGEINTEHSVNPVPLWFITSENHSSSPKNSIGKNGQGEVKTSGLLSDIAPTVLDILEIKKPDEMTGESLLPLLK